MTGKRVYAGHFWDADADLYYAKARWYEPTTGRFVSVDPIKDGVNWYNYCNVNPITFTDPTGMWSTGADYNPISDSGWGAHGAATAKGAESAINPVTGGLMSGYGGPDRRDVQGYLNRLAKYVDYPGEMDIGMTNLLKMIEKGSRAQKLLEFNLKLRSIIDDLARANASNHSCEVVQLLVMEMLGFDVGPFLSKLAGRTGIKMKIETLTELAQTDPDHVKKLTPEEARKYAKENKGDYILLALMDIDIQWKGETVHKAHAALVIASETDITGIGGGGMIQKYIDKGWVLSNVNIHFSYENKVNYFYYSYKN